MANFQKMFPSKYLKAADLEGSVAVEIARLEFEWVGQGQDAEEKGVLHFEGRDQGLVLNKTNAAAIAEECGDDTDDWIGKRIVLYPTRVSFGSKMVDAIRVKPADENASSAGTGGSPNLAEEAQDLF